MKYEKYEPLLFSKDALEFKFKSVGPKGEISIVVQFMETDNPSIYNLVFGNLVASDQIDDYVKNDNKDRNKILATVASAIYEFTARHPDRLVFFNGSTPQRTRLYRMALSNNLAELSNHFVIYGVNTKKTPFWVEEFKKGKEYFGFLVKRKIN